MDFTCIPLFDRPESGLSRFDRTLVAALRLISVACFSVLLLLLVGNVFVRSVPIWAFFWFDEIVEGTFAWMVFFGAAALWARDQHFRVEWVSEKLQGTIGGHLLTIAAELLSLLFIAIFFYQSFRLTWLAQDWTPVFNLSRRWLYVCMPVSGLVMLGYSVRSVLRAVAAFRRQSGDRSNPPG